MKAYQGISVFSACFTLLSLVSFSNSILFFLFLSFHITLNIKKKQKTNQPNQPCLMQFEARPAHFIKHCKTLSSTRVFMCNQMQQLAWLQLLLGLLHRSTWLDFSSAANSGGAFSLTTWTGLGEIMYLVLSATTWRGRNCWWVGKPEEFPAPLPAQFNTGKCYLILPSVSPWFWTTLCQAPPPWLQSTMDCWVGSLLCCHTHTLERSMSTARQRGTLLLTLSFLWMGSRRQCSPEWRNKQSWHQGAVKAGDPWVPSWLGLCCLFYLQ